MREGRGKGKELHDNTLATTTTVILFPHRCPDGDGLCLERPLGRIT